MKPWSWGVLSRARHIQNAPVATTAPNRPRQRPGPFAASCLTPGPAAERERYPTAPTLRVVVAGVRYCAAPGGCIGPARHDLSGACASGAMVEVASLAEPYTEAPTSSYCMLREPDESDV
jgi:hypothetical protein